jgi:hypothetical protein
LFLGKSVLTALSLGECRTPVTGVLVTQARKSGLAVLAPCCLAGEPDVEAATAEPQEDCSCGLVEKLLAAGGLLLASASSLLPGPRGLRVEELLAAGHLADTSVLLVEELRASGSLLLASASGLFLDEAMVLARPQFVDGPLPILVRAVRASISPKKNGPPDWPRRQQSGSLLVFADGSLLPIFDAKRATKGVQGGRVVAFVVVEQPLGGAWGRLQPFELQPPGRIGEGGQGQMSRR